MDKKRPKMPDQGLGKFCIVFGGAMTILPFLFSRLNFGRQCSAAAAGLMGLSWGLKQVAAAKKWRQKYGEPSFEELMEIKKSHSVSNLPVILLWFILAIAALACFSIFFMTLHEK